MVNKEVQSEKEMICHCEVACENSEVPIKEEQIILKLKRSKCTETEWKEYEEKVQSEMKSQRGGQQVKSEENGLKYSIFTSSTDTGGTGI